VQGLLKSLHIYYSYCKNISAIFYTGHDVRDNRVDSVLALDSVSSRVLRLHVHRRR